MKEPKKTTSLSIKEYVQEEVTRQGYDVEIKSGKLRVKWMLQAWKVAIALSESNKYPSIDIIEILGKTIEPKKNKFGFRKCMVRVGYYTPPHPSEIKMRLERLWKFLLDQTPIEAYKEFEMIHPFEDGNGRTGKILLNWLNKSLNDPVFPPQDLFGYPQRNP
jgi:Fic family protein